MLIVLQSSTHYWAAHSLENLLGARIFHFHTLSREGFNLNFEISISFLIMMFPWFSHHNWLDNGSIVAYILMPDFRRSASPCAAIAIVLWTRIRWYFSSDWKQLSNCTHAVALPCLIENLRTVCLLLLRSFSRVLFDHLLIKRVRQLKKGVEKFH